MLVDIGVFDLDEVTNKSDGGPLVPSAPRLYISNDYEPLTSQVSVCSAGSSIYFRTSGSVISHN